MALDFPNTPTLNQVFTAPNGAMWMWDGVKWTAIASVSPNAANNNVGRNLIHNPLFNVAQRGAGPFTTNMYTLDRWQSTFLIAGQTVSIQSVGITDGSRAQIGDEAATTALVNTFTGSAAVSSYVIMQQSVEDVRRLAGKTVTVSFWATASSGTPKLAISLDQVFGSGGSPSANVNGNGIAVTLSTTWARYQATISISSISGKTIGTNNDHKTVLNLWCSAETTTFGARTGNIGVQSGTIQLWGVQLEVGSVATPLEKPDPRYDLANCQRFYQAVTCAVRATTPGVASMLSPVYYPTMRATPTSALLTAGSRSNISSPSFTPQTVNHGFFGCASTGAVDAYIIGESYYLSADL